MSKCNFLFFLNAYNDLTQTSTPLLNNFKWSREVNGVPYTSQNDQQIQVLPSTTTSNIIPYPFSNIVTSQNANIDGTTTATLTGSNSSIAPGQLIIGGGMDVNTFVKTVSGTTLTLSQPANTTGLTALSFYTPASFIYMESDQSVSVIYNNGSPMAVNPFQVNGVLIPGVFFMNGPAYSLTVTNSGTKTANIFFASMG